jgi:hypothetical protein
MRKTTHRDYLLWLWFLDEEWNKPNKTDHYLMQIADNVENLFKKVKRSDPNSQKLSFTKTEPLPELTEEEAKKRYMERAKAAWKSRLGV